MAEAKSPKNLTISTETEDDVFVPEEEEEGSHTQGDGLMFAKAKRQSSRGNTPVSSPVGDHPKTKGK